MLRSAGFRNVIGVDPSRQCRINASYKSIQVFKGSLSHLPVDLGQFDCVILTHVIEHICDAAGAMRAARKLTKPTGILYVEVPDAEKYSAFDTGPFQEFNTEHINCFSVRSLRNLAAANSMPVIEAGTGQHALRASSISSLARARRGKSLRTSGCASASRPMSRTLSK